MTCHQHFPFPLVHPPFVSRSPLCFIRTLDISITVAVYSLRDLYIRASGILTHYARLPRYIMFWLPGCLDELHGDRGVDRQLQTQANRCSRSSRLFVLSSQRKGVRTLPLSGPEAFLQQQGRRCSERLFLHMFRDIQRTDERGPRVPPQGSRTKITTTVAFFASNHG